MEHWASSRRLRTGNFSYRRGRRRPWKVPRYALVISILVLMTLWWSVLVQMLHKTTNTKPSAISHTMGRTQIELEKSLNSHQEAGERQKSSQPFPSSDVLTFYFEPSSSVRLLQHGHVGDTFERHTSHEKLSTKKFPGVIDCGSIQQYPINDYPEDDAYLPWIHDIFASSGKLYVVAQNRRRCQTGAEKETVMKYWEPQMSLFQPIPVKQMTSSNGAGSRYTLSPPEQATTLETRFQCRFHSSSQSFDEGQITLSEYSSNYEYVAWRKRGNKPMFSTSGRDVEQFEFSTLLFHCPIPQRMSLSNLKVDIIPIRTPARVRPLLTMNHTGPRYFGNRTLEAGLGNPASWYNSTKVFGNLPRIPHWADAGRISNIPVCPNDTPVPTDRNLPTRNNLVLCTWTSASYNRRGDATVVDDSGERLREWIVFHKLVGADHLHVYDNTQVNATNRSPLETICSEFDYVTYHAWPCRVCSNNRPNHRNPGERSSQYAAEASCRQRYGPDTKWMSFLDTDEYLVPRPSSGNETNGLSWTEILQRKDKEGVKVLKMRSSRGRPRVSLLESTIDPQVCLNPTHLRKFDHQDCLVIPSSQEGEIFTFLQVYNCDYIPPPRPERFARAMKQIYQPSFVLQRFVHYSTITTNINRYYRDHPNPGRYSAALDLSDWSDAFLNELTEGVLIHAKTVLPHETKTREDGCRFNSKRVCIVGHACPSSTLFVDENHTKNVFSDENGNFCNCWVNQHVEERLVPRLQRALSEHSAHQK